MEFLTEYTVVSILKKDRGLIDPRSLRIKSFLPLKKWVPSSVEDFETWDLRLDNILENFRSWIDIETAVYILRFVPFTQGKLWALNSAAIYTAPNVQLFSSANNKTQSISRSVVLHFSSIPFKKRCSRRDVWENPKSPLVIDGRNGRIRRECRKQCTISKLSDGAIMMEYKVGYQNCLIVMLRHSILSVNMNNWSLLTYRVFNHSSLRWCSLHLVFMSLRNNVVEFRVHFCKTDALFLEGDLAICSRPGSNRWLLAHKTSALTTELQGLRVISFFFGNLG